MPIYITALEFDDDNLEEIEAHGISMQQVESVLVGRPKFFPNKRGRSATDVMVGPDSSGSMISTPIIATPVPGRWRPVTAYESGKGDIAKWRQAK